jgi:hypothetical protein
MVAGLLGLLAGPATALLWLDSIMPTTSEVDEHEQNEDHTEQCLLINSDHRQTP